MGESLAPSSANRGAAAPERARIEIGMLRNGLGSIRNLELLIKSIKVGQKGLFSAVAAVHADCAPMIANALGLAQALLDSGVEQACAERLSSALSTSLTDLERVLASAVAAGRLSVAQRLSLERDLARCARELGSTLPLVSLIERASRPPPVELTPAELVHGSSAERSDPKSISVERCLPPNAGHVGLHVDLEAAKMLVAVGVALVTDGRGADAPAAEGGGAGIAGGAAAVDARSGNAGAVHGRSQHGRDGRQAREGEAGLDGRAAEAPAGEGAPRLPRLGFEVRAGGAPVTTLGFEPAPAARHGQAARAEDAERALVRISALRVSASSVMCAEVAARCLGARFEYDRDAHRVCIYWPLS